MRGHIEKRGKNSYSMAVSLGKDATFRRTELDFLKMTF